MRAWSNPRQHEQLGRVEGRCCKHHLAPRTDHFGRPLADDLHPRGATVFNHDFLSESTYQRTALPFQGWLEIGVGGRPATAAPDRRVHRAEAFLLLAVVVVRRGITRLNPGLNEGFGQRVVARAARDVQRAASTAPAPVAAVSTGVPMLHPFEIGQHVGISPALRTAVGPAVIVLRVAAHINHAIDRTGPADHFSTGCRQTAIVEVRLWLG